MPTDLFLGHFLLDGENLERVRRVTRLVLVEVERLLNIARFLF